MAMTDGEEGACALVIGSNGERKRHRGGGWHAHVLCSVRQGRKGKGWHAHVLSVRQGRKGKGRHAHVRRVQRWSRASE
jgi:hypothetical protein